jgi:hypothetical protein
MDMIRHHDRSLRMAFSHFEEGLPQGIKARPIGENPLSEL